MNLRLLPTFLCLALTSVASAQSVQDSTLAVKTWVKGLENPTGLAFLPNGSGDALVIQKDSGKVQLIHNRKVTRTLLDLNVASDSERGLLGIALHPQFDTNHFVYLYYTAAPTTPGGDPRGNRIARYSLQNNRLVFDEVIADLQDVPGPNNNGGKILFGPDNKLYAVVGDLNRREKTQNYRNSTAVTRSSMIIRLNDDGTIPTNNPFYQEQYNDTPNSPINKAYAYGIRNSYGLAFDSVTDTLWDTEIGANGYDEINRVEPGFNSGWARLMGPRSRNKDSTARLVRLGRRAQYADPEFSWRASVSPTDLLFGDGDTLGSLYGKVLLVGDSETGNIFTLRLRAHRNSFVLKGGLSDSVADNSPSNLLAEQYGITWGSGFGAITDLIAGPDGLYVLSSGKHALYRIAPINPSRGPTPIPEPASLLLVAFAPLLLLRRRAQGTP